VIALVLGGARSGKSAVAERMIASRAGGRAVTYVATAAPASDDADFAARIASHRARRPPTWLTLEIGPSDPLPAAVARADGPVLIDSLTTWVAGAPRFAADVEGLCVALRTRGDDSVVVSDEVGLGVHPSSASGREFRDALGLANQAIAAIADDVVLVVAGRTLRLERD
jgi:adenosylcobinamide kinase/adenosylcobinamide-phosphate guanylyltransferase